MQVITRECPECLQTKLIQDFNWYRGMGDNYRNCKQCEKNVDRKVRLMMELPTDKEIRLRDPRYVLLQRSIENALTTGIEHRLKLEDIPTPGRCIYFRTVLEYRTLTKDSPKIAKYSNNLASLDRIDSGKGYVPGNVQVISYLANRMKQTATPEQLIAFAKGILRVHKVTS